LLCFSPQGSIDVGGAYRETMSLACQDLMQSVVPLFIESPNGTNNVGLHREKRIINPAATSPQQLEMFKFVGVLMGAALRSKFVLPLDLSSTVWKQIIGDDLTEDDLETVDKLCLQACRGMLGLSPDQFEGAVEESFTTRLSDGSEVELKPAGRTIAVTSDNAREFVDAVIRTRLNEGTVQALAIRKGLEIVVPLSYLSLFQWYEVETLVCGSANIDIDALRKHTTYSAGMSSSHPTVRFLFRALESFTEEEKRLFLQFVWGRNRLPLQHSDWVQPFTINLLMPASDGTEASIGFSCFSCVCWLGVEGLSTIVFRDSRPGDRDGMLPVAHTCFFSLDLPPYSTYEVTRSKILYAIVNCQAIDADFNPTNSSMPAW
jgi:hypothetical protein